MMNNYKDIYHRIVRDNPNSPIIRQWRTRQEVLVEFLQKLHSEKPALRILELGSGRGFFVKELRARGMDVTGSDFNPYNIKLAKEINDVALREIDALDIPLPADAYDVVISAEVIEHLPDLKQHLKAVKRVLRVGGYYCITTPNYVVEQVYNVLTKQREDSLHISSQTHRSLRRVLAAEGFAASFLRMRSLTKGQQIKLSAFSKPYPVQLLPKILQPSIVCTAKLVQK